MTTRITKEEVERIGRLARIELGPEERATFEHELSAILDFVAKLNEVPTANIEPMTGGAELMNVTREDEISGESPVLGDGALVEAAPEKRDGHIAVRAVFDREA